LDTDVVITDFENVVKGTGKLGVKLQGKLIIF